MKRLFIFLVVIAGAALGSAGILGQYAPPPVVEPDDAVVKKIGERTDELRRVIDKLRGAGVKEPLLADVEIFHKAAVWIVKHHEFYTKDAGKWTLEVLDRGFLRATQQSRGEAPWLSTPGLSTVRAYRSMVDGSVQPYAVTLPASYGKDPQKQWRVDVVLHGRSASLTEVSFLRSFAEKPAAKDQDYIRIDIFGRLNNAYRWAGETDVAEVIDNFAGIERVLGRATMLDSQRFVLRGFSMGGAGTWHLGLHRPDRWCVIGPGAGFTSTHGYIKDLPAKLPPYQEACLHIYDAVDYAENAFDVPVVAYAGSEDPQLAAARNIEAKLKPLGIPMTLLVGMGLAHKFPPEWEKKAESEYAKPLAKGRPEYPPHVRFVTWTLKYPACDWVDILALERHYQRALVDAEYGDKGFVVKTVNVRTLDVRLPRGAVRGNVPVRIDGQEIAGNAVESAGGLHVYLEKSGGKWQGVLPEKLVVDRLRVVQKTAGLQGPIDDAFTGPFLCVRGTGQPWHAASQQYADANLQRFADEWSKYFRGELPIKADSEVTSEDIATKNLILFGDPSSNSLIAQVLPRLPLKWTKEKITLNGNDFDGAEHVPVMIFPSPLHVEHYVVLNSGHTFHAAELQGTNAQLYPRLGDYAVLKRKPTPKDALSVEVVTAGLCDDFWRMEKGQ